jgi:uncharacterized protein YjiS (DUF1127 family)
MEKTSLGEAVSTWRHIMFVTYILSQIRAYLRHRKTVRELSHLSDRELNDLGIVRYDIDYIARNSAAAA